MEGLVPPRLLLLLVISSTLPIRALAGEQSKAERGEQAELAFRSARLVVGGAAVIKDPNAATAGAALSDGAGVVSLAFPGA